MKILIFFLALFLSSTLGKVTKKTLFCYYRPWAVSANVISILDIDPDLCTHIIYYKADINETTHQIQSSDPQKDFNLDGKGENQIKKLMNLKKRNRKLKILIGVGGLNVDARLMSEASETVDNRRAFIQSALRFMREHHLDGIDIQWEWPTVAERYYDRPNFVLLLKELREATESEYLLTVRLLVSRYLISRIYDVTAMAEYVDYAHLETYNYFNYYYPPKKSSIMSPIKGPNDNNIESTVNYFLNRGFKASQLNLGIAAFALEYQLAKPPENEHYFYKPINLTYPSNLNIPGISWRTFRLMCNEKLNDDSWSQQWDVESSTPFLYKDRVILSYDDPRSVKEKMKYIYEKGLGGATIMYIDDDDFTGNCYDKKFPIIITARDYIFEHDAKVAKFNVTHHSIEEK